MLLTKIYHQYSFHRIHIHHVIIFRIRTLYFIKNFQLRESNGQMETKLNESEGQLRERSNQLESEIQIKIQVRPFFFNCVEKYCSIIYILVYSLYSKFIILNLIFSRANTVWIALTTQIMSEIFNLIVNIL